MHPYVTNELATIHQAQLRDEAAAERLARMSRERDDTTGRRPSVGRLAAAAAIALLLALTAGGELAGLGTAAQHAAQAIVSLGL